LKGLTHYLPDYLTQLVKITNKIWETQILQKELKEYFNKKYNRDCEYTNEELYTYLTDEEEVGKQFLSSFRRWDTYLVIVKIRNKYIGYEMAETTGDDSAEGLGYGPSYEYKEYEPIEVLKIVYRLKE